MSSEELREAIRSLLNTHPSLVVSPRGHAAHAERYVTTDGAPIGFEPERVKFQNLWVRADSVRLRKLSDIDHRIYPKASFDDGKPNHDLYGEPAFKDTDLICFKVTELWQAVRVIGEAAGGSLS